MKLEGFRVCLEAGHGYHDDGLSMTLAQLRKWLRGTQAKRRAG
jgi:hypothetical protein